MKFIAMILSVLCVASSLQAQEVNVGEVKCYLTSGNKHASQTLTSQSGFAFPETYRKEFVIPVTTPQECIDDWNMCEGGPIAYGSSDQYQNINGEKVRAVIEYEDGKTTGELRVRTSAAYSDGDLSNDNGGLNVSLQNNNVVYTLNCHKSK